MIRLDYYVRRDPALEQEEFQALWLQDHGKLWVKHADTLGLRRYTQVHDWPEHPLCKTWRDMYGASGYAYDGVSTACWPSYKVLESSLSTPAGAEAMAEILAHEKTIMDTPNCILSFGVVGHARRKKTDQIAHQKTDCDPCRRVKITLDRCPLPHGEHGDRPHQSPRQRSNSIGLSGQNAENEKSAQHTHEKSDHLDELIEE